MLTIRLQRAGKKNKADYRVVLAEKTAASQKKFTEIMGSYNPHTKTLLIRNQDRLNYWVNEQHVEISATVRNLLISKEIIKGDKTKAFTIPKKEVVAEEAPAETSAPADAETATETVAEANPEQVEAPAEAPAVEEASVEETPAVESAPEATTEATPEATTEAEVVAEAPAEASSEETPAVETEEPKA